MRDRNTKEKIYEVAVFTKVSEDLKFVKNKQGYSNKVPVGKLEVCIAVRIGQK